MNEATQLSRADVALARDDRISTEKTNGGGASRALAHLNYPYDRMEEQGTHLLDYWRIVRKHVWLILGVSVFMYVLKGVIRSVNEAMREP